VMREIRRSSVDIGSLLDKIDAALGKFSFRVFDPPSRICKTLDKLAEELEESEKSLIIEFKEPVHVGFMFLPDRVVIARAIEDPDIVLKKVIIDSSAITVRLYRDGKKVLDDYLFNYTDLFSILTDPNVRRAIESGKVEYSHKVLEEIVDEVLSAFDRLYSVIRFSDVRPILRRFFILYDDSVDGWYLRISLGKRDYAFNNIVVYVVSRGRYNEDVYAVTREREEEMLPVITKGAKYVKKFRPQWIVIKKIRNGPVKWYLDAHPLAPFADIPPEVSVEQCVQIEKIGQVAEKLPNEIDKAVKRILASYLALYALDEHVW